MNYTGSYSNTIPSKQSLILQDTCNVKNYTGSYSNTTPSKQSLILHDTCNVNEIYIRMKVGMQDLEKKRV